jgi:hypothetical protein
MKTLLSSLAFLSFFGFTSLNAQCTIDQTNTDIFAYPSTATVSNDTVFLPELGNGPYEAVFQLNIPASVDVSGTTLEVVHLKIDDIVGLPDGLSKDCNPSDCKYLKETKGCFRILGTAGSSVPAGAQIELELKASGKVKSGSIGIDLTNAQMSSVIGEYTIILPTASNLKTEELTGITNTTVYPNPANTENVYVEYNAKTSENTLISIIDVQGKEILNKQTKSWVGANKENLRVADLQSGVYFVKIQNSKGAITKKISIM